MNSLKVQSKKYIILPILIGAMLLVVCIMLALAHIQTASAANGKDFNPSRIIDNAVFYNASAMNASQIQAFLSAKVSNCDTNGTQPASDWGYPNITHAKLAEYKRNGTNGFSKDTGFHAPPYTCLKDFKQNTPQMEAASGLCGGLIARSNRTAAQIIKDVSDACSINPQVLIVLLQKEQSLVTDNWPLNRQYKNATGFACPDTAPCNPAYNGFFYQVYHAARQFKVYKAYPTSYNYIAGRTNRIYWHPDLSRCGSSNVYIENQATAALYIYTPYRPNQAALNNLYGTGDSCSSYGNRNFWRLFTDWFGSTQSKGLSAILSRFESLDQPMKTTLGSIVGDSTCTPSSTSCSQTYENGAIIWSSKTGAWESYGPIRARWAALGYQNGLMGYPMGAIIPTVEGGYYQKYQNGYIIGKPATGYWESKGGIRARWAALGYQSGSLGYPTSQEVYVGNGGYSQTYENGAIIWSSKTGAWESYGPIRARWAALGYQNGLMGYPMGAIIPTVEGGYYQKYQNGYIIGKPATGYWESKGGIRARWAALGYQSGVMGYPAGGEMYDITTETYYQQYEHNKIFYQLSPPKAWVAP